MADELKTTETVVTPEPETKTVAEAVGKDGEKFDPERAQALIDKLRAEQKELKAKAKRADELEAEAKKRADAELSEIEKATKRAEEAERRANELAHKQAQRDAAEAVGLPLSFASRLQGGSPEELKADAELLLSAMPKPSAKTNTTNPGNAPAGETDAERRRRLGLSY